MQPKLIQTFTLLFLSLLTIGCGGSVENEPPPPPTVRVATPLIKSTVLWDEFTGRMAATDYVEIRARVSGYLQSIHFDEGQIVEKGDLLFIIDPRPFTAALKAANAKLTEAEARLSEAKSRLATSKAEKKQAEARLDLAKSQYNRAEKLVRSSALSQEEVDVRKSALLQAEADVESSNSQIEASNAGIATAEAAIATAGAEVEQAELDLDYANIHAPVSGRISRELITEGNLILGGVGGDSNILTTIVSLDPIYCYLDANEQTFIKYQKLERAGTRRSSREYKNPVLMRTIGESDFEHQGHMDFVDNRLDDNTGTIRARAIFPNPDGALTPGQFGELMIPGSGVFDALLIPDTAILADQSKRFVYVLNDQNELTRREIERGKMVDGLRQIESGLQGSDRIVLSNLQKIQPGMKVSIEEVTIEPTEDDGLPDSYEPVPEAEWLQK